MHGDGSVDGPGRRRLLVADDDPHVSELVTLALADDFLVAAESDGARALRAVAVTCPDIVLLDLEMPHMDGLEACRRIRAACPSLPIVILTGNTETTAMERAFAAGASDYLAKPFTPVQLRTRLRACLLRSGAA
jgi:DNA-binding response OmpR family regulator